MIEAITPMNHHPLLIKGIEEFNQHEFFAAHETLEDYWRTLAGDEKELVQSIIQAAVAYYHFGNGNKVGAGKLLLRAIMRAGSVAEGTLGIHIAPYLATIKASLQNLENEDANASMQIPEIQFLHSQN